MITSTSNAKVKRLVNLKKKKKLRDEEGVFLVEGIRMFREVPKDRLVEVYASEEFWNRERKAVEQVLAGTKVQPEILADFVFEYVSDTKTPQGILCLVRQKQYSITEIVKEKGGELPLLPCIGSNPGSWKSGNHCTDSRGRRSDGDCNESGLCRYVQSEGSPFYDGGGLSCTILLCG